MKWEEIESLIRENKILLIQLQEVLWAAQDKLSFLEDVLMHEKEKQNKGN